MSVYWFTCHNSYRYVHEFMCMHAYVYVCMYVCMFLLSTCSYALIHLQRVPPSRPNGMALNTVDVELYETHPNADVWNVTLVMEILPSLCDHDIPLMTVSVQDTTDAVQEASFERLQNASLPLGGQYTLKFNGIQTRPLDYDASAYEARQALLEEAPYIESLSSWTTPLPGDVLKRYCPGRRLSFRFERLPGDQPFIEVNAANLTGSDVKVSYTEVSDINVTMI